MRTVDLYSGIGGWSLGLKLAGLEVVASFEWWQDAANTHTKNLGLSSNKLNIRELELSTLPKNIDVVVGSPPCTQFSFANRGGSGDMEDGLKDIVKFLQVVTYLKPKYWAMENVPRLTNILISEREPGGALHQFNALLKDAFIETIDFSEFGTPQRRKRCIAGNFDSALLNEYKNVTRNIVLGDVVGSLSNEKISDPIFNIHRKKSNVSGLENEESFSSEELRINREAKVNHPVYNNMQFPDSLEKTSRTITATCTRVSRESVVIQDPLNRKTYRRLNVRERASCQGFPISYNFFGKSYSAQLKMIGNAIPPTFTYLLGNAFLSIPANEIVPLRKVNPKIVSAITEVAEHTPDSKGRMFRDSRSFQFAIEKLRFKSGTRFELNNEKGAGRWSIQFFFGDSKNIHTLELSSTLLSDLMAKSRLLKIVSFQKASITARDCTPRIDHKKLQDVWTKRAKGTHPFLILDELNANAIECITLLESISDQNIKKVINHLFSKNAQNTKSGKLLKIHKFGREIICGMLIGCHFNIINKSS